MRRLLQQGGVSKRELGDAYQKILEENEVLRKCNAELLKENAQRVKTLDQILAALRLQR